MSSILKALKKLEEEQSGRAASPSYESGGQLVTSTRGGRPLLLLVGGIGVGLLLAGGLYLWLGGDRYIPAPPAPAALEQKPAGFVKTATLGASPVAAGPSKPAPSPPTSPLAVRPVKEKAIIVSSAAPKFVAAATTAEVAAETVPPKPATSPEEATKNQPGSVEQVEIRRRDIPAPGQQWSAPQLTVNDIMPASGGGRMAIVNGLPVMEGTMVEDAVVREIRPDQVIFDINGKSVAVPLSPSRQLP